MFHRWLDEVIVSGLNVLTVLGKDIDNSPATFLNIALDTPSEADIIRSQHKYLEVH